MLLSSAFALGKEALAEQKPSIPFAKTLEIRHLPGTPGSELGFSTAHLPRLRLVWDPQSIALTQSLSHCHETPT
jgi:hypothetical protein